MFTTFYIIAIYRDRTNRNDILLKVQQCAHRLQNFMKLYENYCNQPPNIAATDFDL